MTTEIKVIVDKLIKTRSLSLEEYEALIENRDDELFELLKTEAVKLRQSIYGNRIFIRGLIEISNYCKNDCYYCGIRRSNSCAARYRMSAEDIMLCCKTGYEMGT